MVLLEAFFLLSVVFVVYTPPVVVMPSTSHFLACTPIQCSCVVMIESWYGVLLAGFPHSQYVALPINSFPPPPSLFHFCSPSLHTSLTVSALAFDQYGELSQQLEQESAMREKAETFATQVHNHCASIPWWLSDNGGVMWQVTQ